MNKRAVVIVGASALAAFALLSQTAPVKETLEDWGIVSDFRDSITSGRGAPYAATLESIGQNAGLPPYLLARVAYQESRFRDDIISGKKVSPAGALGMFQIIPRYHPTAKPLDWQAAAVYAAGYLNSLYEKFGDWAMALAAYNWGPGNIQKKGMGSLPTETSNYYTQILADIPNTGSAYA